MPYRTRPTADKGLYPLPGGGFEVRWSVRGKPQWKRLRGYTKSEAREYRNKQIGEKAVPGRLRFSDLVRLKRLDATKKQNRTSAAPSRALAEFFGYAESTRDGERVVVTPGWKVVEITNAAVQEFEAARSAGGAQRSTLQHDLAWLRRALKLAVTVQPEMRCPTIETHDPQNVRTNFPEPEQVAAILAVLPEDLRGVIAFAVTTAWRVRSMILPLRWSHVDWKRQIITLPAELSKNKKPVKFPFGPLPDLKRLLERQLASAEPVSSDYVFHRPDGHAIDYKVMRKAWRAACRKAKCPGMWLHDLCRVGARNLRRAGVSETEIMKLGRWKTPSMFHRYDIVDEQDLNRSVEKLAKVLKET